MRIWRTSSLPPSLLSVMAWAIFAAGGCGLSGLLGSVEGFAMVLVQCGLQFFPLGSIANYSSPANVLNN